MPAHRAAGDGGGHHGHGRNLGQRRRQRQRGHDRNRRLRPGNNLIANGDFSSGATNWHTEMGTGNVNGGAYCVSSPGGSTLVG